jgi:membrane protein YqaA with SNARE-associated domain
MTTERRLTIARILALLIVIALTVFIFTLSDEQIERLEAFGYLGIAILTFLSNATVLIPAPGLLVVFTMGARLNPLMVGIFAGIGGALGELSGYLAGFSGQALIENIRVYQRSVRWMEKYGALTIILLSMIPNPVFDITGIAAGVLRMPIWKFLGAAWIGITMKMITMAYAGAGTFSIPWIENLLRPS